MDPKSHQGLEEQLRKVLRTSILTPCGHIEGGCISQARKYDTDQGRVFVKWNQGEKVHFQHTVGRAFCFWFYQMAPAMTSRESD
ncbi:hypothetical protein GDO81_020246, partial [Engystomops pustulosus]